MPTGTDVQQLLDTSSMSVVIVIADVSAHSHDEVDLAVIVYVPATASVGMTTWRRDVTTRAVTMTTTMSRTKADNRTAR